MPVDPELEKDLQTDPTIQSVSVVELGIAYSGPATLVNRFYVTIGEHGVRIAFAERTADGRFLHFRSAVVLSFTDAIQLKAVLGRLLEPIEEALKANPFVGGIDVTARETKGG
jgi:hypothetical protein